MKDEKRECYPLLESQWGLYYEWEKDKEALQYNLPRIITLSKTVDPNKLKIAIIKTIKAHPYLNTCLGKKEGQIVQLRKDEEGVSIKVVSVNQGEIQQLKETFVKPFDLFTGPLYRMVIYSTELHTYLFMDIHHIIMDGSGLGMFLSEVVKAYKGGKVEKESYTAFEYSLEEGQFLETENYLRAEKFFDQKLAQSMTELPQIATGEKTGQVKLVCQKVPKEKIEKFCRENAITPSSLFLSALFNALHRYTREERIAITTISSGRRDAKLQQIMGMFIKALPIVVEMNPLETGMEFVKTVQENMFKTMENEIYPFTKMVEKHKITPQIIYVYQGGLVESLELEGKTVELEKLPLEKAKFPIAIAVTPKDEYYEISIEYDASLYTKDYMEPLCSAIAESGQQIVENPMALCKDIFIVSEEQIKLVEGFNQTSKSYTPECSSIVEMFKAQVRRVPNHIAVVYEEKQYTYQEIDEITDKLAKKLKTMGVGAEQAVGVLIDRSEYMVIYPLAVLKAGGAYMPLDYSFPRDRLEFMIEDAGIGIILSEENKTEEHIPSFTGEIIKIEDLFAMEVDESITLPLPGPSDMFVILYTSGSTGMPKGCILENSNMVNYCKWHQSYYNLTEEDRASAYANFGFDAHMLDIYPYITCGASIYIIPTAMRLDFIRINQYFEEKQITIAFMTTQLGRQFVEEFDSQSLRALIVGGEKLLPVKKPAYHFYNSYGPTECTIVTTTYEIKNDYDSSIIGSPVDNFQLYVLDANLHLLPMGASGELCIGGNGVGRGYLNRPDVTTEKFIMWNGKRIYRTGDLVRWTPKGEIEYLGRMDGQVKLRGLRIELGEIESQILSYPGITSAAVVVKEIGGSQHLCAYYIVDSEVDVENLKAQLATKLTSFMIPTAFMELGELPLTSNGKVNKKALPDPAVERQERVAPQNEIQQQLFDLVANMLGIEDFGITDDLFSIGMTSILAIKLSVGIYNQFNINIKTSEIFKNKTIEKLEVVLKNTEKEGLVESFAKREYYPVTENQLGLYYEWEKDRSALQYNIPEVIKFSKEVDPNQLKSAVLQVVEAHPYLKTCLGISGEQIVQRRRDNEPVGITIQRVSQGEIQQIKDSFIKPFDLFTGPLYRMAIYGTEEHTYLFMDIHHIIIDGSAVGTFIADLVKAYQGEKLIKESYTAFEYALEEEGQIGSEKYLAGEAFFDTKLSDSMTELPKVAKGEQEGQVQIVRMSIYNPQIETFCKGNGVTASNLFLSALCTVLHRYTRSERIAITIASSGRSENKLHGIMGMLVKTLPLVVTIHPGEKVVAFVKAMQENMFETMENELYPFTHMVERHKIVPQINYAYQGGMIGGYELEGQVVEMEELALGKAKFPLTIFVSPQDERYEILMEYDDRLYTEDYIQTLSHAVAECVNKMVENPMALCEGISIVSDEQIKRLGTFNETTSAEQRSWASIVEMFTQQVKRVPHHLAVVYEGRQYTYQELDKITDKLAKKLKSVGVGPEKAVGVLIDRSEHMVIYPLAILKAGGAYMPLDYSFPTDRLEFMIQDAGVEVILSEENKVEEHIPGFRGMIIKTTDLSTMEVDDSITLTSPGPNDMFIILYTSGSTGMPKGCILENRNIANYCNWHQSYYDVTELDRAAAYANFGFDAHMLDLYPYITCGATVYIIPGAIRMDFMAINQYLEENQLSIIFMTTQLGRQFAEEFDNKSLRVLIVGGEKLLPTRKPAYRFFNGYGPTECTIFTTNYEIKNDYDSSIIGKPLANYQLYVLDTHMQLLPVGVSGELCIGGDGVGRGYLNRPDMNNEKFVMWHGKRVYRTGDMVRWTDEGEIEYIGRMDGQVKLRGLRIELGEIESQMLTYPRIVSCAVAVKEIGGTQHLCGYYTAESDVDIEKLKAQMATKLTSFMIPTAFTQLDKLPITSNGKVDKKALPAIEIKNDNAYVPPTNDVEEKLCTIFAETLKMPKVGITDSFFELGGTSLLVMKVVVKAMAMDIGLTYANVFKYQTPQQLADFLTNKVEETVPTTGDLYDYQAIDKLLQRNTLGEMTETPIGDILLTGATGFLGVHVLKEFLKNYPGKVYCLMRSKDGKSADARLKVRLAYYFENDYHELFGKRIFTIEGDMNQLVASNVQIDTVINCAAIVKHFSAGDELTKVNVVGVQKLIDYCLAHQAKLIQISTTSVAGTGDTAMKDIKITESQLYFGQGLDNKYTHTKFLAERYVLEAAGTKGLKGKVMRVGNLMSRNSDGEFQINFQGNAFMSSLKAYKLLGKFPISLMGGEAEFSPIDSTAKAILKLGQTNGEYTVFHPYNNHDIYMSDVIYVMKECGFDIEIVSDGEFEECLREKMQDDKMIPALTGLLAYEENNTGKPIYGLGRTNKFTTETLYRLQFKWPMTSELYIKKAIESLAGLGFFDE